MQRKADGMSEHPNDDRRLVGAATTGGDQVLGGGVAPAPQAPGGAWGEQGTVGRPAGTAPGDPPGTQHTQHTQHNDDPTLAALTALAGALESLAEDERILAERLRRLQRERSAGRAWRDILNDEEAPGTMQIVSRMLARLAEASGTLRRDLVEALRKEGTSIPAIARLFGVTHQRVSNLLRRSSG